MKAEKNRYFDYVLLTTKEYDKLVEDYGETPVRLKIFNLDNYIGERPKVRIPKYSSHYRTIRNWFSRDGVMPKSWSGGVKAAICSCCKNVGTNYSLNYQNQPVYLCNVCLKCLRAMGITHNNWGKIAPLKLETLIGKGKAKLAERPKIVAKDTELVQQDRVQKAVRDLGNYMAGKGK